MLALIGRNAAGKTNILKVIEERAQFAVGAKSLPIAWLTPPRKKVNSECTLEFSIKSGLFKYEINISRGGRTGQGRVIVENLCKYDGNDWQIIAKKDHETAVFHHADDDVTAFKISASAPMIHVIRSLLPQEQLSSDIESVFNYLSKITYYDLDNKLTKEFSPLNENHYQQWLAENKKIEPSVCMRLLHLWRSDKEAFEEINALLGENGLNLIKNIVINAIFIDGSNDGIEDEILHRISFNAVTRNNTFDYADLSFGTQRILAIILALIYDDNSTLLIEQPEDGIHVGLLRKVLPLCFTYAEYLNKQLMITTHSAEIIDLLEAKMIRFVKMTEEGTKVSALDDKALSLVPRYIENEGTLSEFLETEGEE